MNKRRSGFWLAFGSDGAGRVSVEGNEVAIDHAGSHGTEMVLTVEEATDLHAVLSEVIAKLTAEGG